MKLLFSIFADDEADVANLLSQLGCEIQSQRAASSNRCIASVQYDDTAARWRIDLSATEMTPEQVGACFDALISVHVAFPRQVWLSTYDRATIAHVATPRVRIIGTTTGHLLEPEELDALLELRPE